MTSLVGVQCTETSLAFCPECFATGVEVVEYKANHGYKFLDNGNFLPLNNNWSAKNSQLQHGVHLGSAGLRPQLGQPQVLLNPHW